MPINATHPSYNDNQEQWHRCVDCYDGEDAVKREGVKYLPRLTGQDSTSYEAYKKRAMFYAATARTIDGDVGALVARPPVIEVPEKLKPWLDNVTGTGVGIVDFIKKVATEVLMTNRAVIVVDKGKAENSVTTMSLYSALELVNWTNERTLFVLTEKVYTKDEGDPYTNIEKDQWRELFLDNGIYRVRLWQKNPKGNEKEPFIIVDEAVPNIRGITLNSIPIVITTATGQTLEASQSSLVDMVNVNLSHYRTSADLEHGRHLTALPTPWVCGVADAVTLRLGSESAWIIADPAASCGFLEFSGAGLAALERGLEQKEAQMAVLGARMIQGKQAGVEAAETARIHQAGEIASLRSIASAVEDAVEKALNLVIQWESLTGEAEVELNKEFLDAEFTFGDVAAVVAAYQAGGMSLDTFLWNLKRGNMMPEDTTIEDESAKIAIEREEAAKVANENADRQLAMRNAQVAQQAANSKIPPAGGV